MKVRRLGGLVAVLALVVGSFGATPARANQTVSVPDHDLRLCITRNLGIAADAPLTATRMAGMGYLFCSDSAYSDLHIGNLVGVEYLTNAEAVLLGPGHITDLSPLASLSSLTNLGVAGHRIADLAPLAGLTKLRALDVSGNPVDSLTPLVSLPELANLDINNTSAANLGALASMPKLNCLAIGEIPSADYSLLLQLSGLRCLTIDDHMISSLAGIPMPPHLTRLQVWAPRITALTGVEKASGLERFYAGDKSGGRAALADISALSGMRRLVDVELGSAEIENISSLADKPDLNVLIANGNRISDLSPLKSSTKLQRLEIFSNRVDDLSSLSGMHQLIELGAWSNSIRDVSALRDMPSLATLDLSGNQVSDVSPLAQLANLQELHLSNNRILDISPLKDITAELRTDNQRLSPSVVVAQGVAVPLGIRNRGGALLCATNVDTRVRCKDGKITYPAAGTYTSIFTDPADGTWSGFSGTITQSVSTVESFGKAYGPTLRSIPVVGSAYQAPTKAWTPRVASYTYQWYRDGKRITGPGSDGYSYTPVAKDRGHRLNVCVTGHRVTYQAKRLCSARSAKVAFGKLRAPKPKFSGEDVTDSTLTAVRGTWTAGTTLRYQWQRNHKNIRGATAATFRLRSGDVGDHIRVRITGSKSGYHSSTRFSSSITQRRAAFTAKVPTITGTAAAGQVLTVQAGAWSPEPTHLSYRWYRNGTSIKGATATTYVLTVADIGKQVTVKVTGTRAGYGSKSVFSRATALVVA